ncbi:MAG: sporulation protein YabP [Clostridia bacterium]|nr:sporulation protein YabP [Clostridia bacterium]
MNTDANKANNRTAHSFSVQGREAMEVRGVTDVISFDEQTVLLSTVCGNLEIGGSALHIHVLSMEEGIVTMDGKIDSVTYYESPTDEKGGGFFSKIFR